MRQGLRSLSIEYRSILPRPDGPDGPGAQAGWRRLGAAPSGPARRRQGAGRPVLRQGGRVTPAEPAAAADPSAPLDLLGWRRATAELYAAVRAAADPAAAWRQWRRRRDELFAGHPQSPIEDRAGFTGLPYFEYAPQLRFTATVAPAPPAHLDVGTSDGTVPLDRIGRLDLPVGSLDLWWIAGYGGGLFLPFADATNRDTTYGGGRYLLDTIKGADLGGAAGRLVVDFNFAYHPSCRYSPRWSCPLAPAGNRLTGRIEAGELLQPR